MWCKVVYNYLNLKQIMELKDFKDVIRVMTKEEFESTIEEDIKFVEGFKNFLKHDDATRIVEHIKSVLEASKVDIRLGRGLANQIKINKTIPVSHKPKEERRMMFVCGDDIASLIKRFENESK